MDKRIYITKVWEYQEPKNKDVIYEIDIHALLSNTRGIGQYKRVRGHLMIGSTSSLEMFLENKFLVCACIIL